MTEQGGEVVSRGAHNAETAGSIPAPAINVERHASTLPIDDEWLAALALGEFFRRSQMSRTACWLEDELLRRQWQQMLYGEVISGPGF